MLIYNATNKHLYSDNNAKVLQAAAEQRGWPTGEFAGFRQWRTAGRSVKKGEQGVPVVFFVPKKDAAGGSVKVRKVKHVFNVEQTEPVMDPIGGQQEKEVRL